MEEGGKSRLELGSQEGVMDGKGKGESNGIFSEAGISALLQRHWNVFTFLPSSTGTSK